MLNLTPANINDTEYNIYGTSILGNEQKKIKIKPLKIIKKHKIKKI